MREPVFTETMQIGIVVRDLDATVRRYEEEYGIGPWQFFDLTPEMAPNLREGGRPIAGSTRNATAKVGSVWWELTQPLDGEFMGVKVAYLPTARTLGVTLEVFKGDRGAEKAESEG